MKQSLKRFSKTDIVHRLIAWLGACYARFVLITSRMDSRLPESSKPYFRGEKPVIFALWHSRILLIHSHAPKARKMKALVSSHSDGRLIGRVLQHMGIEIVSGSTSKGGAQALRSLVQACKQGYNLSITPDGPRGPARLCSDGVAQLAMLTKVPIICVGYAATHHKRLRSWDKFMVALPFSRIYFLASEPFSYESFAENRTDKHHGRERLRLKIEQELNRITDEADRLAHVEPA